MDVVNTTTSWVNELDTWLGIDEPYLPTQSTEAFFSMFIAGVIVIYISHLIATIYMLLKLWKQRNLFFENSRLLIALSTFYIKKLIMMCHMKIPPVDSEVRGQRFGGQAHPGKKEAQTKT